MKTAYRIISLLLAALMLFSISACTKKDGGNGNGSGDSNSAGGENANPFVSDLNREGYAYENEYTLQHLEFIASDTYRKICADGGGLASDVANNYEDAKLNYVNGTWQAISKATAALGEGELELVNEYEILVTKLMQNTSAEEGFTGSFQKNYFDAVLSLLSGLKAQLGDAKKNVEFFTGDELEKAQKHADTLDKLIVKLEKLNGASDEEATGIFGDAVKEIKATFEKDFIKGNEKFIDSVKGFLGKAADVSGFLSDKVSAVVDEYLMYQAFTASSKEWETVWSDISSQAKSSANATDEKKLKDSYEKVAKCIDKILDRTKAYRTSNAAGLFTTVIEQGAETVSKLAYDAAYKAWDGMMKSWPAGQAVRAGMVGGVGLANMLVNCDDIAYYGQMLIGYGKLGECAYTVLEKAGKSLESKKDYSSALLFDKAFNIYKEIQLSAADCTISYCTAIVDNPIGYIFKYTSDDQIAQTYIVQIYKADWMPIRCHGVQKVINNGGNVVGFNGNVYYFKLTAESVAETGTNANFTVNNKVNNSLICRNAKGEEAVVIKTNATGGIYICGDKLYYRKQDYKWYCTDFNGSNESQATTGSIIGAIDSQGMLIVQTSEYDIYATDFNGNQINLLPKNYTGIAEHGNYYYNYTSSNSGYIFYRYNFETNTNEKVGTANIPVDSDMWRVLDDICVTDEGIYFLVGYYAGTGNFFQGGCIGFLSFETGSVNILVDDDITLPMMYMATEDDNRYLYYFNTNSVLGVQLFQGCINTDVIRLDLKTGERTTVDFPLCGEGIPFINGTSLQILQDGKNSATTIIDDAMLKKMGYTASLGFAENGNAIYHQFAENINGTYYVSIMEVTPDDASSIGWRQGYRRVSTKLYSIEDNGEKITLIYQY